MKIVKNNLKVLLAFLVGIIVSGLSVYAISASDVDYGEGKVSDALDILYTTQNTTVANYETIYGTLNLTIASTFNKFGSSGIQLTPFRPIYKYFRFTTESSNTSDCVVLGWANNQGNQLVENTNYNTNDYGLIYTNANPSSENTTGTCNIKLTLYN